MKYECSITDKETEYIKPQVFSLFKNKIVETPDINCEFINFEIDYQGFEKNETLSNKIVFKRKNVKSPTTSCHPAVVEEMEMRDGIIKKPVECRNVVTESEWKSLKYFFPNNISLEFENKISHLSYPLLLQPNNPYAFIEEYLYNHSVVVGQIRRRMKRLYGSNLNDWFIERNGKIKYFVSIKN